MLAYVFWHWRRPRVPAAEYEAAQRGFHAALAEAPPAGFERSFSVAVAEVPWLSAGGDVYEDWYLVDGSAALDPLNQAAVSASRQKAHDRAAALAAGGIAGLYSLRLGAPHAAPGAASWFAKPDGMPYRDLFAALEPLARRDGAAVWCRHMTLGPGPEFCLHSAAPLPLPGAIAPRVFRCRAVRPG
jgi:hypothetical protein